jgi:hypothetical protein
MQETSRLLEAAAALSRPLRRCGIAHAFHGNILAAVLSSSPTSDVSETIRSSVSPHALTARLGDMLCRIHWPWRAASFRPGLSGDCRQRVLHGRLVAVVQPVRLLSLTKSPPLLTACPCSLHVKYTRPIPAVEVGKPTPVA